jgi:hypothetical protein
MSRWIPVTALFLSGCLGPSRPWTPVTPAAFGPPPASRPAAPASAAAFTASPGPAPATASRSSRWKIPRTGGPRGSSRGRAKRPLYFRSQPDLGPLPQPGPATPANPLFPAPSP